jgi:hypothetical protein
VRRSRCADVAFLYAVPRQVTALRASEREDGRFSTSGSRIVDNPVACIASPADNPAMDKDRDLLPWIFGGLSMATVAIAISVGSTNGTAPRDSQAPRQPIAYTLPEAKVPTPPVPASVPAPAPAPAPTLAAAQTQTVSPPTASNNQIWECTINGQKTFSDSPCGGQSSVRELGPINRMDPTPVLPHARSYVPESSYQPGYSYQGDQEDSNPGDQQFANNSYPVFVGFPVHDPRRPDRARRPHGHNRVPSPRKN